MKKTTPEEFINKSKIIHNDLYDYSLVEFVDVKVNVKIICSKHGWFEQRPQHHLAGHGCNKCARELITASSKLTKKKFLIKAKKVHNKKYNYSLIDFVNVNSNKDKVRIMCPTHGEFKQAIKHHLNNVGCPHCCESKGEKEISKFLKENKIKFIRQYRFKGCRYKKPLPFDFYLPKLNICIEFQGEQHFRPAMHWGGKKVYQDIIKRDKIKEEYCKSNNIYLIKIHYKDKIEDSLKDDLKI